MTKAEKMYALVDQWKVSSKTQKCSAGKMLLKWVPLPVWVVCKKRSEASASGYGRVISQLGRQPRTHGLLFFATYKAHQVSPHKRLKHVLENIMTTKYSNVRDLYPQNFKANMQLVGWIP